MKDIVPLEWISWGSPTNVPRNAGLDPRDSITRASDKLTLGLSPSTGLLYIVTDAGAFVVALGGKTTAKIKDDATAKPSAGKRPRKDG